MEITRCLSFPEPYSMLSALGQSRHTGNPADDIRLLVGRHLSTLGDFLAPASSYFHVLSSASSHRRCGDKSLLRSYFDEGLSQLIVHTSVISERTSLTQSRKLVFGALNHTKKDMILCNNECSNVSRMRLCVKIGLLPLKHEDEARHFEHHELNQDDICCERASPFAALLTLGCGSTVEKGGKTGNFY